MARKLFSNAKVLLNRCLYGVRVGVGRTFGVGGGVGSGGVGGHLSFGRDPEAS